ncbi:MAG TPA: hypothetical protein VE982_04160 [Gaiellaceae bacterium]|nr:hypothetical protein [Gaiellaceae bacterium]
MSRSWAYCVFAIAAATAVAGAVAPAGGAPEAAPRAPVGVISVTGRSLVDRRLDEGPRGRGAGDVEITWQALYNKRVTPRAIGHAQLQCTYLTMTSRSCVGTYFLPRGKLMVAGVFGSPLLYEIAVVGGTGIYTGARGSLLVTQASERPVRDILVFQLVG